MKQIFIVSLCIGLLYAQVYSQADSTPLNGVTFGFGAGYNISNHALYSYSLTPDETHALKIQALPKSKFVISSVIAIKLGRLAVSNQNKLLNMKAVKGEQENFSLKSRLVINVGLNLVDISSNDVAFNKNINGGLGIGCLLNDFVQVAVFYDISTERQLRDYIVSTYINKSIPNGSAVYNALDENDNNLFYNKTFGSFSFKIIFSLANKKS